MFKNLVLPVFLFFSCATVQADDTIMICLDDPETGVSCTAFENVETAGLCWQYLLPVCNEKNGFVYDEQFGYVLNGDDVQVMHPSDY